VIDPDVFFVMHIFMNIGNCLRFVVFVCVCVTGVMMSGRPSVLQATTSGRLTSPDARWRRCEELRTSQCVVSHIAPFSLPLGVCHVVTCSCCVAFVGMLFELFLVTSFFLYKLYVCVYIM
jgi:hypothetical protein